MSNTAWMELESCRVDLVRGTVVADAGSDERLTTNECALLAYLAERPDTVVTREELLSEVFGYAGSARTRTVDNTIRRVRLKVESDPSNPRHILTVFGAGYRFVPKAAPQAESGAGGAPGTGAGPFPYSWLERSEVDEARERLSDHRLVTLTGPGGIGKTTAARMLSAGWDEGPVVFVELTAAADAAGIITTVAETLDVALSDHDIDESAQQLAKALHAREGLLLVLDNLEQAFADAASIVHGWFVACPSLRLLVTSRRRLGVRGEQVVELAPFNAEQACELYRRIARTQEPRFDLDDSGGSAMASLSEALDGNPMAIELAARRSHILSPAQVLERLADQRFALLQSKDEKLHASIAWSLDLLEEHDRIALEQLRVFSGGFALEAAERVLDLPPTAPMVLDVIQNLRETSLLTSERPERYTRQVRFDLPMSVRAYLDLECDPPAEDVVDRHALWALDFAQEHQPRLDGEDGAEQVAALSLERGNLMAVVERFADRAPVRAAQAALVLQPLSRIRGTPANLLPFFPALVAALESEHPELAARLHLAWAHATESDFETSSAQAQAAHAIAVSLGDDELELDCAAVRLGLSMRTSRLTEARAIIDEYIDKAQQLGDSRTRAYLLSAQAQLLGIAGRWDIAEEPLMEARRILIASGNRRVLMAPAGVLLHMRRIKGQLSAAWEVGQSALEIAEELGDLLNIARFSMDLGVLAHERGSYDDAVRYLRFAIETYERAGRFDATAVGIINLANTMADLGRLEEAEVAYERARTRAKDHALPRLERLVDLNLGMLCATTGRYTPALAALDRAMDPSVETGMRFLTYGTAFAAACEALRGSYEAADRRLEAARALQAEHDDDASVHFVAVVRAIVAYARTRSDEARAGCRQVANRALALSQTHSDLRRLLQLSDAVIGGKLPLPSPDEG